MIIVAGSVAVKPECRADAVRACLEVTRGTKLESGCIAYDFYADLADPNHLHVYEEWESDAALQAHIDQPHTQSFLASVGQYLAAPPVIIRHVVSESGRAL